jgi:hypothetical protein
MDDGCGDSRWHRPQFSTCGFTLSDINFLSSCLIDTFDIQNSVCKTSRKYYVIVVSAKSFDKFYQTISPHIIPSMRYKIDY